MRWTVDSRSDLAAIGILLGLIAIKAWERIRFPEWLGRTDILNQYLPWWSFLGRQLRDGDIPGWNPYQLSGTPFLGDPQSGWMYLPVMIPFTLFPPLTAIKVYLIVQLVIAGCSMYAFARLLSFGAVASLGAAVAYSFGPFLHYNTYCCNIQAHAATWIPLGLIGIEVAVRASTWNRRLLGWALSGFAVSQILAGWIGQGAYISLLLLGAYLAYRVMTVSGRVRISPGGLGWLVVHSALFLSISFGLGAAAVLPRLDVMQETNLSGGNYDHVESEDKQKGGDVPGMLARLLGPDFDQRRTSVGAGTLALALIGVVVAWRLHPVPFFLVQTITVLILTLKATPVHQLFYVLPQFRDIHEHAPSRVLGVLMIGPAILAAAALDAIPRLTARAGMLAAVVPFTGLGLIVLGLSPRNRTLERIGPGTLIAFLAVTLIVLALVVARLSWRPGWWSARGSTVAPVLLLLVVILEPAGRDLVTQLRNSPVHPRTMAIVNANLAAHDFGSAGDWLLAQQEAGAAPFRYLGYNAFGLRTIENDDGIIYQNRHWTPRYRRLLIGPRSMFLGLPYVQGYNPVQLSNTVALFETINGHELEYHDAHVMAYGMDSPWLDLLSTRYFIVPAEIPPDRPDLLHLSQRYRTVYSTKHVRILENHEAYPRAWIVHDVQIAPFSIALDRIAAGSTDPRQTAIVDLESNLPSLAVPANPAAESVVITRYEADSITMDVQMEADGIVVLGEIFDPGWRVLVNGRPAGILQVDGVLRGVALGAGQYQLEFQYAPPSIPIGLGISGLAMLLMMGGQVLTGRLPGGPAA